MTKLETRLEKHIDLLIKRYPDLSVVRQDIIDGYLLIQECYENGGKLLVAGNGGSAADSEHIVGELMKRFKIKRPIDPQLAEKLKSIDQERGEALSESLECALMAIPLTTHEALTTAFMNDVGSVDVYAQQLLGYGREGDVFLGISTSGNSENIIRCIVLAKALGIKVVGLTGITGGKMRDLCDVIVKVPEKETYMIQEYHLPVYHCWCLMLEDYFFSRNI